jgi:hypothetical protein
MIGWMMKLKTMTATRTRTSASIQTGFSASPSKVARGLKKTPPMRWNRFMG